ncbi:unnamed protein product, partial [Urochloa humidicola]
LPPSSSSDVPPSPRRCRILVHPLAAASSSIRSPPPRRARSSEPGPGPGRGATRREQGRLGERPRLPLRGVRRLAGDHHARVPMGPPSPSAVEPRFRSAALSLSQSHICVLTWSPGATAGRRRAGGLDNVATRGVVGTALLRATRGVVGTALLRIPLALLSRVRLSPAAMPSSRSASSAKLWSTGVES